MDGTLKETVYRIRVVGMALDLCLMVIIFVHCGEVMGQR